MRKKIGILLLLVIVICMGLVVFVATGCGNTGNITGVTITSEHTRVAMGETISLSAAIVGTGTFNRSVGWRSENLLVATVASNPGVANGQNAVITAREAGIVKIVAMSMFNQEISRYIEITVYDPDPQATEIIVICKNPLELAIGQEAHQLNWQVVGAEGFCDEVKFEVYPAGFIDITGAGVITPHVVGEVNLTVRSVATPDVFTTIKVVVSPEIIPPPQARAITFVNVPNFFEGYTHQIVWEVLPAVDDEVVSQDVIFVSSNTDIATVDANGLITARAPGNFYIRITSAVTPNVTVHITNIRIEADNRITYTFIMPEGIEDVVIFDVPLNNFTVPSTNFGAMRDFVRWEENGEARAFAANPTLSQNSRTFVAVYKQFFTVNFYEDGTLVETARVERDTAVIFPTLYDRSSSEYAYVFNGWVVNGTLVSEYLELDGDRTFVADWTRFVTFAIFDHEGTLVEDFGLIEYGTLKLLPTTFAGFDTNAGFDADDWRLVGWLCEDGYSLNVVNNWIVVNTNLEAHAILVREFLIRFEVDGWFLSDLRAEEGAQIDFPALTQPDPGSDDYFLGWYQGGSMLHADQTGYFVVGDYDVVWNARWQRRVTVRFYEDGVLIRYDIYNSGEPVSEQVSARSPDYYEFLGWFRDADQIFDTLAVSFPASITISLDARWREVREITFEQILKDAVSGDYVTTFALSGKHELGTSVDVPALDARNPFLWQFMGWQTADLTVLFDGEQVGAITVTEATTFTAVWQRVHRIIFVEDGVELNPADNLFASGETVNFAAIFDRYEHTLSTQAATGYRFLGWFYGTDLRATSQVYSIPATEPLVLTARWQAIVYVTFIETFFDCSLQENMLWTNPASGYFDLGFATLTQPVPDATRDADLYAFGGWQMNGSFFTMNSGWTMPVVGPATFTAIFNRTYHRVETFDYNGDPVLNQLVPINGLFNFANLAGSRGDRYRFDGWFTEAGDFVLPHGNFTIIQNMQLFAQFTSLYMLTFYLDDFGSAEYVVIFAALDEIVQMPTDIVRQLGLVLVEWQDDGNNVVTQVEITGDAVFRSIWYQAYHFVVYFRVQILGGSSFTHTRAEAVDGEYVEFPNLLGTIPYNLRFVEWVEGTDVLDGMPFMAESSLFNADGIRTIHALVVTLPQFTVFYDDLDGQIVALNHFITNGELVASAIPVLTRTNYDFRGWMVLYDGVFVPFANFGNTLAGLPAGGSWVFHATWMRLITFTIEDVEGIEIYEFTIDYGILPFYHMPDFMQFKSAWFTNQHEWQNLDNTIFDQFEVYSDHVRLRLVFTQYYTFTVVYTLPVGATPTGNPTTFTRENVVSLDPASFGAATFVGWFTDRYAGTQVTQLGVAPYHLELFARFAGAGEQIVYTLELAGNVTRVLTGAEMAGLGLPSRVSFDLVTDIPRPASNEGLFTGYNFINWHRNALGGTITSQLNATNLTANTVNLTAHLLVIAFTIQYTGLYGDAAVLNPNDREFFTFYCIDVVFLPFEYQGITISWLWNGVPTTYLPVGTHQNVVLVAYYEGLVTYNVTIAPIGGLFAGNLNWSHVDYSATRTTFHMFSDAFALTLPTLMGHTAAWEHSLDGGLTWSPITTVDPQNMAHRGGLIIRPVFTPINLTISFASTIDGVIAPNAINFAFGDFVTVADAVLRFENTQAGIIARNRMNFVRWFDSETGDTFISLPAGNRQLTNIGLMLAPLAYITYTVNFQTAEGMHLGQMQFDWTDATASLPLAVAGSSITSWQVIVGGVALPTFVITVAHLRLVIGNGTFGDGIGFSPTRFTDANVWLTEQVVFNLTFAADSRIVAPVTATHFTVGIPRTFIPSPLPANAMTANRFFFDGWSYIHPILGHVVHIPPGATITIDVAADVELFARMSPLPYLIEFTNDANAQIGLMEFDFTQPTRSLGGSFLQVNDAGFVINPSLILTTVGCVMTLLGNGPWTGTWPFEHERDLPVGGIVVHLRATT
jgi:hypothetical protein